MHTYFVEDTTAQVIWSMWSFDGSQLGEKMGMNGNRNLESMKSSRENSQASWVSGHKKRKLILS